MMPQFDIVAVYEPLGLLNRFFVAGTFEVFCTRKVIVNADKIDSVLRHEQLLAA
jgi:hypothetical protein